MRVFESAPAYADGGSSNNLEHRKIRLSDCIQQTTILKGIWQVGYHKRKEACTHIGRTVMLACIHELKSSQKGFDCISHMH